MGAMRVMLIGQAIVLNRLQESEYALPSTCTVLILRRFLAPLDCNTHLIYKLPRIAWYTSIDNQITLLLRIANHRAFVELVSYRVGWWVRWTWDGDTLHITYREGLEYQPSQTHEYTAHLTESESQQDSIAAAARAIILAYGHNLYLYAHIQ